jgi:hypothetical protein
LVRKSGKPNRATDLTLVRICRTLRISFITDTAQGDKEGGGRRKREGKGRAKKEEGKEDGRRTKDEGRRKEVQ